MADERLFRNETVFSAFLTPLCGGTTFFFAPRRSAGGRAPGRSFRRRRRLNDVPTGSSFSFFLVEGPGPARPRTPRLLLPRGIDGNSDLLDMDDLAAALQVYSPKAEWNGSGYTNAETGVKSDNVFLIYQDTYVMGDPGRFMGSAQVEVPEKYFTVK